MAGGELTRCRLATLTIRELIKVNYMFDQGYQQLYIQKQIISLSETYPCPRCKCGCLESFGETETFACTACNRKFVAINAGRILYPACRLKLKIAPIFWWDGLHWHWAGTTASFAQAFSTIAMFMAPMLMINTLVFLMNHGLTMGPLPVLASVTHQSFLLNLCLLNILVGFFMAQLLYLLCWDQDCFVRRNSGRNKQVKY